MRTWIIFDRYLNYKLGGGKQLAPPQFVLLV
jgi:hypothetical protein